MSWKKIFLPALIGVALFLLFRGALEQVFMATLGKYVFEPIQVGISTHIAFIGVLIFCGLLWLKKLRNRYTPSRKISALILSLTIIYSLYRLFDNHWEINWIWMKFDPSSTGGFRYADAIYLVFLAQIILWVRVKTKAFKWTLKFLYKLKQNKKKVVEEQSYSQGFFCDEALDAGGDGDDDDHFGYSDYAKKVTEELFKTESKQSFAVGISGSWGSGKTSFMNLMKRAMKGRDFIAVDFEPWNSQSPQAIVQDFFNTLQEALTPYHGDIGNELESYTEQLLEIDDSKISRGLKSILGINSDIGSTQYADKIKRSIHEIGKKIIVFIDDTDRLNNEEILEVLRIIRNTANFPNTYFVVGFDRYYLTETIAETQNASAYLEKIFQLEISLPMVDAELPIDHLFSLLKEIEEIDPKEYHNLLLPNPYLAEILHLGIRSFRDATRLANNLIINFAPISKYLLLRDSLMIETLRLKHPELIAYITRNQNDVFVSHGYVHHIENHKLYLRSLRKAGEPFASNYKESKLLESVVGQFEKFGFQNEQSAEYTIQLFSKFFPEHLDNVNEAAREHLSITNPFRFSLYFQYSLGSQLDNVKFAEAREKGKESLLNLVTENIKDGKLEELIQHINVIKNFINKNDFETVLSAQFQVYQAIDDLKGVPSKKVQLSNSVRNSIELKFRDKDRTYKKDFFEGSEKQFKTFVRKLLSNSNTDRVTVIHKMTCALRTSNMFPFPLTHEELFEISYKHFKQLIRKVSRFSSHVWDIYGLMEYPGAELEKDEMHIRSFPEKARQEMKRVVRSKFPREFVLSSIQERRGQAGEFYIDKDYLNVFRSFYEYHQWCTTLDVFPEKEEFIFFLECCKDVEYDHPVPYHFNKIKPGTYL